MEEFLKNISIEFQKETCLYSLCPYKMQSISKNGKLLDSLLFEGFVAEEIFQKNIDVFLCFEAYI